MAKNDAQRALIHALTKEATAILRASLPEVLVTSTAARHQLLNRLLNEAIDESARSGRPAVRAADAAMTAWVEDHYIRPPQQPGAPPAAGTFANPESSTKQWYSEIRRPWTTDVSIQEGDWYRARLDFWRRGDVLFLAWRFFATTYKGQEVDTPEHDRIYEDNRAEIARTPEVTNRDDASAVDWFLNIAPQADTGAAGMYHVTLTEADLEREAESFHRFCARLPRTGTFKYPKRKAKGSQPTIIVQWPKRRFVRTLVSAALTLLPVGCYLGDRAYKAAQIAGVTISAGAVCDDARGTPVGSVFFSSTIAPPLQVLRDDVLIGTMQATRQADDEWKYVFHEEGLTAGRMHVYTVVKRMWATGERLYSGPSAAVRVPRCRAGNHQPTVSAIRITGEQRAGSVVTFDAADPFDADGDPLTFLWNFGDNSGNVGSERRVTYVYREAGTYRVSVIVSDNAGTPLVMGVPIVVGPAPPGAPVPPAEPVAEILYGRVSPRTGPVGTVFSFEALPPANPELASCRERVTYSFRVDNGKMPALESGWIGTAVFRGAPTAPGAWHVAYKIRCGERMVGLYSFGMREFATVAE